MHKTAIKARLAVQVGHLYKRCNAERGFVHLTRRARQREAAALLHALQRVPPCAAARAAPQPFSERAEPLTTFSTGC
jgi:hypothetical protein